MPAIKVKLKLLNAANFSPFGEVISCERIEQSFLIHHGQTERYHNLAQTHIDAEARLGISIFRNLEAMDFPKHIDMLERHPLTSRAFIPMQGQAFIVVVAPSLNKDRPDISALQAFITTGSQGINYHAGTWHHPLLTINAPSDFVVIDRIGSAQDYDTYAFEQSIILSAP